jgi:hypothetical protein
MTALLYPLSFPLPVLQNCFSHCCYKAVNSTMINSVFIIQSGYQTQSLSSPKYIGLFVTHFLIKINNV